MDEFNRFERMVFRWVSGQPLAVAVCLPMAAFAVIEVAGVLVLSRLTGHGWWPRDPYALWLVTIAIVAMTGSYWTAMLSFTAVFVKSRRYKLIELYQTTWDMRQMSWREFEDLVAACYQLEGNGVELVGRDRPDGGRDVVVRRNGKTWLVQCKHYRDSWVGERPLRELFRGCRGGEGRGWHLRYLRCVRRTRSAVRRADATAGAPRR